MRTANGAFSLARNYYVDPQIFLQEKTRIFFRQWLMLGRHDDLFPPQNESSSQTVRYYSGEFAGAPLLLVESTPGHLEAFHNVCRHRGATLVNAGCGALRNGILTCPYHAWSYDSSGKLVGAPNMQEVNDFQKADFGLRRVAVVTRHGFVFVNFSAEADSQAPPLEPLEDKLRTWGLAGLKVGARLDYQVAANWKLLFENYSECYHCPTVHPALNRLTPFRDAENEMLSGGVLGGPMHLAEGMASMSSDGGLVATPLHGLNAQARRLVYYFTALPNAFVSLHPDYVLIHRLIPRQPDQTQVCCEFLVQAGDLGNSRLHAAVDFWDLTNRQDWEMCERVQSGAASPGFAPGPLSNLESVVAAFDRHYLTLCGDGAWGEAIGNRLEN